MLFGGYKSYLLDYLLRLVAIFSISFVLNLEIAYFLISSLDLFRLLSCLDLIVFKLTLIELAFESGEIIPELRGGA